MSMGHISCKESGYLEKERSRSSHMGTKDRSDSFEEKREGDGMSAYKMTCIGSSGQGFPAA